MDVHESKGKNELTMMFELPGVKKEDVTIDVRQNRLTVSGHNRLPNDMEEGYRFRERRVGRFARTIILPNGIKVSQNINLSCQSLTSFVPIAGRCESTNGKRHSDYKVLD